MYLDSIINALMTKKPFPTKKQLSKRYESYTLKTFPNYIVRHCPPLLQQFLANRHHFRANFFAWLNYSPLYIILSKTIIAGSYGNEG